MHVDVDEDRIAVEEQRQGGVAVARQEIGISATHGTDQQLVAHRTAVDEQELHLRIGAVVGGNTGVTEQLKAFALHSDRYRIGGEVTPHDARQALELTFKEEVFRGKIKHLPTVEGQRERYVRPRHGEPLDDIERGKVFGACRFEEFESSGRGIKQLAHLDARARLPVGQKSGGLRSLNSAGIDLDAMRLAGLGTADDGKVRHGADRGQRLSAKAHGDDMREIVAGQFRGGMAFDRQNEIGRLHPLAVVFHQDEIGPAVRYRHRDTARTGIERILDQFLDGAGRAFDHLARGDAVDGTFGETADFHKDSILVAHSAANRFTLRRSDASV